MDAYTWGYIAGPTRSLSFIDGLADQDCPDTSEDILITRFRLYHLLPLAMMLLWFVLRTRSGSQLPPLPYVTVNLPCWIFKWMCLLNSR